MSSPFFRNSLTSQPLSKFPRVAALFAFSACCSLLSGHAEAEKADSQKKTKVDAEFTIYDGKTDTTTLKGNVEITRGTLLIKADAAINKDEPDGGGNVMVTGSNGRQVFFRQKRDGGPDLWIEGSADRVEYDKKTEVVKFIGNSKVQYLNQQKVTRTQDGEFLSYDSINDVFTATNSATGKQVPGGGRVTITTAPRNTKPETKQEK